MYDSPLAFWNAQETSCCCYGNQFCLRKSFVLNTLLQYLAPRIGYYSRPQKGLMCMKSELGNFVYYVISVGNWFGKLGNNMAHGFHFSIIFKQVFIQKITFLVTIRFLLMFCLSGFCSKNQTPFISSSSVQNGNIK